jgi:Bacterial PH domain
VVIRFESKRDLTFPIIWGFVFVIYASIGVGIIYSGGKFSDLLLLFVVWLGIGFLFWLLLKTTYYTLEEENLTCHIFGFKKRIPLKEIKHIEPQKGLYAGLKINTSWKGLVVTYGKWDEILISPADEKGFIETIQRLNPMVSA